jgi:hypothetical protein
MGLPKCPPEYPHPGVSAINSASITNAAFIAWDVLFHRNAHFDVQVGRHVDDVVTHKRRAYQFSIR